MQCSRETFYYTTRLLLSENTEKRSLPVRMTSWWVPGVLMMAG